MIDWQRDAEWERRNLREGNEYRAHYPEPMTLDEARRIVDSQPFEVRYAMAVLTEAITSQNLEKAYELGYTAFVRSVTTDDFKS